MIREKAIRGLAYLVAAIVGGWGIPILTSAYTSTETVGAAWWFMAALGAVVGAVLLHVIVFTSND